MDDHSINIYMKSEFKRIAFINEEARLRSGYVDDKCRRSDKENGRFRLEQ
ncbi:MAG: hypothetical protein ACTSO2_05645 [Promethearchaeota archaeon]